MSTPLIISTPEQLVEVLAPYFESLAEKAMEKAANRANDQGRMVGYEEARKITGLGKTRFSQAVNDGSIPHYPNGMRGKLFKLSDLRNFEGYRPQTEAEKQFENELKSRK
jgi:hypothetical protein